MEIEGVLLKRKDEYFFMKNKDIVKKTGIKK